MTKLGGWTPSGFGGRLRRLREAAGLTQQQVAERAGCNQFTVSKLEAGKQEPAWPLVLQLADALGVSTEEFRSQGDEAEPAPPRRRGRPRKADVEAPGPAAPSPKSKAASRRRPKRTPAAAPEVRPVE